MDMAHMIHIKINYPDPSVYHNTYPPPPIGAHIPLGTPVTAREGIVVESSMIFLIGLQNEIGLVENIAYRRRKPYALLSTPEKNWWKLGLCNVIVSLPPASTGCRLKKDDSVSAC